MANSPTVKTYGRAILHAAQITHVCTEFYTATSSMNRLQNLSTTLNEEAWEIVKILLILKIVCYKFISTFLLLT